MYIADQLFFMWAFSIQRCGLDCSVRATWAHITDSWSDRRIHINSFLAPAAGFSRNQTNLL